MKLISLVLAVVFCANTYGQSEYKQNLLGLASITFPVIPEYHVTNGRVTTHFYKYKNELNEWSVVVRDFTKSKSLKLWPQDLSWFYQYGIKSIKKELHATLINENEIELDGLKAIEFEYSYINDQRVPVQSTHRLIFFNNMIFSMNFTSVNGTSAASNPGTEAFFTSFKITSEKSSTKQYNLEPDIAKPKQIGLGILGLAICLGAIYGLVSLIF